MAELVIEGISLTSLKKYADDRGFFREIIRIPELEESIKVQQISHSEVFPGVLKAWHGHHFQYQWTYVLTGTILVSLVDMRKSSATFKKNINTIIGGNSKYNFYGFPPGVLHGYKNIGEKAQIIYFTSGVYNPEEEIRYDPFDSNIPFSWYNTCKPR